MAMVTAGGETEIRKAIALHAPDDRTYPLLARALAAQGKFDKIPDAWVKYCDRVPSDPDGWRRLGAALDDAGKPDRAIKMLSVGVDTNPDDINWGHAGTLGQVTAKLREISEFLNV